MNTSTFIAYIYPPKWMIPAIDPSLPVLALTSLLSQNAYFHELGHALALKSFTKDVFAKMVFNQAGASLEYRQWGQADLNKIGAYIGLSKCELIFVAAGPLMDSLTEFFWGILAQNIQFQYPVLSLGCRIIQLLIIKSNLLYAFNACLKKEGFNDFYRVQALTSIHSSIFSIALLVRSLFVLKALNMCSIAILRHYRVSHLFSLILNK